MEKSVKEYLDEFSNDIDELKKDSSFTQNEIWVNQVNQFFQKLDISESDIRDFNKIFNEMKYSSSSKPYDTMKMFFKLLTRKGLSFKKKESSYLFDELFQPTVVPTKKIQAGSPITVLDKSLPESIASIVKSETSNKIKPRSNKIFIAHGNDAESKLELASLLKDMELEPIILHQQANKGKTIIEKFEEHAGEVNFAFVLFSPDDVGGTDKQNLQPRARQNVILEFGYFLGKLGRNRVCCLYKKGVELPSDMDGLVYIPFDTNPRDSYLTIKKELQAAGYSPKSL